MQLVVNLMIICGLLVCDVYVPCVSYWL